MRTRWPWETDRWRLLLRTLSAVGLVGVCILITFLVPPLRARALYMLPGSAVALAGLYFGFAPALVATVAAVPVIHLVLFDPPMASDTGPPATKLSVSAISCLSSSSWTNSSC